MLPIQKTADEHDQQEWSAGQLYTKQGFEFRSFKAKRILAGKRGQENPSSMFDLTQKRLLRNDT